MTTASRARLSSGNVSFEPHSSPHPGVCSEGAEILRHLPQITQQRGWSWAHLWTEACLIQSLGS